ncbi:MAG TPA: bifunctional oligoribonuclease/PAP phosphatase NrnA [Bacillota bacterium]|nr:bifunctional oligoribonuclease/PAP phosphatase NrnA [Bacillota bacterium]
MDKQLILDKILEYKKIIIHTHIRPDGDCYGSGIGLREIIRESFPEKEAYTVGETAEYLKFIGDYDVIDDSVYDGALSIVLDTGTVERIADQRYKKGDYIIKIDHHLPVDDYGDFQYVDTTRPATAQIILEFYLEYANILKLNMTAAKALYTGIVTDTGRFKYRSVNGDTFKDVAFLLDYGLDFSDILMTLDIKTEKEMKMKGYVLQNFEKTENGVAYIKITPEVIKKFGVAIEEATANVNELSVLADCPVWILFAEYDDLSVRARLRSKGPAIDKLANEYGGGGHPLACGTNLDGWNQADDLLEKADELVRKYKENQQ